MILFLNAELLQISKLLGLDAFNLDALVLNALAHLSALLEVVKTLLLLDFGVHVDLVAVTRATKMVNFLPIRYQILLTESSGRGF